MSSLLPFAGAATQRPAPLATAGVVPTHRTPPLDQAATPPTPLATPPVKASAKGGAKAKGAWRPRLPRFSMSEADDLAGLKYEVRRFPTRRLWDDGIETSWSQFSRCPVALTTVTPDTLPFVVSMLHRFPIAWPEQIARRYTRFSKAESPRDANLWLRLCAERAAKVPLPLTMDNDGIRARARRLSRQLARTDATECRAVLEQLGIAPPQTETEEGLLARCRDERWWRRRLRMVLGRATEDLGRNLGLVRKQAALYVTNLGARRYQQQQRDNAAALQGLVAVNEDGDEFDLEELIATSIANPANRRAELMVRMHGFEQTANQLGHIGDFWTLTTPSRFHAVLSQSGERNPRADGSTVRDAQAHLNRVWQRIRAALARHEIRPYGFRVAEPHHDGTPHWHLLVFLPPAQRDTARAIVRRYALEDSPDEPGALEHRCTFTAIDPARGSATGYIAKYIAKNIDGFGLATDDPAAPAELQGQEPATMAERVRAWASIHGIRQFQQIGGPPVGVWREARRLHTEQTGVLEEIRQAADAADWAGFIQAMGGPVTRRAEQPVRVARVEWWMTETGELDMNRYGEPAALRPYGLEANGVTIATRQRWEVFRASSQDEVEDYRSGRREEFACRLSSSPWSSVNNCTSRVKTYDHRTLRQCFLYRPAQDFSSRDLSPPDNRTTYPI